MNGFLGAWCVKKPCNQVFNVLQFFKTRKEHSLCMFFVPTLVPLVPPHICTEELFMKQFAYIGKILIPKLHFTPRGI
jgi:hypothetical protein